MKKYLKIIMIALGLMGTATAVYSEALTIAVGQPTRGYEKRGKLIVERLIAAGDPAVIKNYEGSDAISRAVCGNEAGAGIVQIDAIYTRAKEGCRLRPAFMYGTEHVYLMVPPNSNIDALDDFTNTTKVLIDTIGSGTDLFWQTVKDIETGKDGNKSPWSTANAINDPIFTAIPSAETGEIDAVIMVTTSDSPELKELYDAGWRMASFYDKDINDELFNGESLYVAESAEIEKTGSWSNESNDSYAVRSFIVVDTDVAKDRKLFGDVTAAAKATAK